MSLRIHTQEEVDEANAALNYMPLQSNGEGSSSTDSSRALTASETAIVNSVRFFLPPEKEDEFSDNFMAVFRRKCKPMPVKAKRFSFSKQGA